MKDKTTRAMRRIDDLCIDLELEGYTEDEIISALLACGGLKAEFKCGRKTIEQLSRWVQDWQKARCLPGLEDEL